MLVLSRKASEKITIGNGITVTVLSIHGNRVRLAFEAPDDVRVLRSELVWWSDVPTGSHVGNCGRNRAMRLGKRADRRPRCGSPVDGART